LDSSASPTTASRTYALATISHFPGRVSRPIILSEIVDAGVRLDAQEAVAIVHQLISSSQIDVPGGPPQDPPSLHNVSIDADGSVACHGCRTAMSVFEAGTLLQTMVPHGSPTRVPGALRYAIARALQDVVAPPFASIDEFSATLDRFDTADRRAVVSQLFARALPACGRQPAPALPVEPTERRRGPSAAELRRQLREADAERYRLHIECMSAGAPHDTAPPPVSEIDIAGERVLQREIYPECVNRGRWRQVVVAALVVMLAFVIGYGTVSQVRRPLSTARVPDAPIVYDEAAIPHESAITRVVSSSVGTVFSPSFTRGGGTLFFHTGRNADASSALKAVDLSGGEPRVTTILDDGARNYHVQPSPAGNLIAFDSDRDGDRGVYLANRDGSGIRRVSGSGFAAVPTWAAEGRRLAFVRAEYQHPRVWNLWLLTLGSGDMHRLTRFRYGQTWGASWFPDGRRICYSHEDRLYIRDLETGAERALESPIKGRQVRTPAVSPDGKRVIFQVVHSGAWLLDLRHGTMTQVLDDPTAEEFAWAPNGGVAFHSRRDGQWGIWLMTPA
jgi:hypothetical protein